MTGESTNLGERSGVVGSGTIACGLARLAAERGDVVLLARSEESARARRARRWARTAPRRRPTSAELRDATFVVEAIVEDHESKAAVLRSLDDVLARRRDRGDDHFVPVGRAARRGVAAGRSGSSACTSSTPSTKMELVELVVPRRRRRGHARSAATRCARRSTRPSSRCRTSRASSSTGCCSRCCSPRCDLLDEHGLKPEAVDACMKLGAGHPMGPLALLDFVGLDVATAIGESIDVPVPSRVRRMVADGRLGRKAGRGLLRLSLSPSGKEDAVNAAIALSKTPEAVRVMLVDRQHLFRAGLCKVLVREGLDVVADVETAGEALGVLEREPVDVVLLDLNTPTCPGPRPPGGSPRRLPT